MSEHKPFVSLKAGEYGKRPDDPGNLKPSPMMYKAKDTLAAIGKDPEGKRGWIVGLRNPSLEKDSVTATMAAHIEEIPPLRSPHPAHRHVEEAIIYIISGRGYSIIDDKRYDWETGDIMALPSNVWHQHFNTDPQSPARFLAVRNGPLVRAMRLWGVEYKPE